MLIHIERGNRKEELNFSGKVAELLSELKINPETVLVAKNNELVTADDELGDKDEVRILSVISGG
ncbi:MoaD/ThiS family protein [Candidatus Woesearchaeota archaeon]|nr:MoaD/ThiS family protein [Candidatus Woesearchaeota archaeon]